jgi:hypothetical protein
MFVSTPTACTLLAQWLSIGSFDIVPFSWIFFVRHLAPMCVTDMTPIRASFLQVVHVEMKPLEVAQERADNKQPAKTCKNSFKLVFGVYKMTSNSSRNGLFLASVSPGRRKQHDKRASETTIRQQLKQVDVLENMGISRHFAGEIKRVLDRTYRYHCNTVLKTRISCGEQFFLLVFVGNNRKISV